MTKLQNRQSEGDRKAFSSYFSIVVVGVQAAALLIVSVAGANAETFHKTKMIDGKGREQPVDLSFDGANSLLTVKVAGEEIYRVPYSSIQELSYELASRHRIKEGAVVMIFSLGAGGVVMLTKSHSHWFYVDYEQAPGDRRNLIFKLGKAEYKEVLATASTQTGKTVEMLKANEKANETAFRGK